MDDVSFGHMGRRVLRLFFRDDILTLERNRKNSTLRAGILGMASRTAKIIRTINTIYYEAKYIQVLVIPVKFR